MVIVHIGTYKTQMIVGSVIHSLVSSMKYYDLATVKVIFVPRPFLFHFLLKINFIKFVSPQVSTCNLAYL